MCLFFNSYRFYLNYDNDGLNFIEREEWDFLKLLNKWNKTGIKLFTK